MDNGKVETTIKYWGYIAQKMEKENAHYYNMLWLLDMSTKQYSYRNIQYCGWEVFNISMNGLVGNAAMIIWTVILARKREAYVG